MNNYGMINFKFQLCCGPLTELTHRIVLASTNLQRFLTWRATLHQQVTKLIVKMERHQEGLGSQSRCQDTARLSDPVLRLRYKQTVTCIT